MEKTTPPIALAYDRCPRQVHWRRRQRHRPPIHRHGRHQRRQSPVRGWHVGRTVAVADSISSARRTAASRAGNHVEESTTPHALAYASAPATPDDIDDRCPRQVHRRCQISRKRLPVHGRHRAASSDVTTATKRATLQEIARIRTGPRCNCRPVQYRHHRPVHGRHRHHRPVPSRPVHGRRPSLSGKTQCPVPSLPVHARSEVSGTGGKSGKCGMGGKRVFVSSCHRVIETFLSGDLSLDEFDEERIRGCRSGMVCY